MAHTAKILIRDVVTATKTDTVRQAADAMKKAGIGCIIVADGDRPIGIFSERDLLNRVVAGGLDPVRTLLEKVMTPNPVCVESSQALDRVFAVLAEGRFRHLPITDGGRVVGIVSLSDLATVLRNVLREDKYTQYFVDYMESKAAR